MPRFPPVGKFPRTSAERAAAFAQSPTKPDILKATPLRSFGVAVASEAIQTMRTLGRRHRHYGADFMVFALINEPKVDGKKTCSIVLMKGDNEQLIEVEDPTPDDGMRVSHGRALVSGRRVKTDYVPKQMRLERDGVIPDYGRSYGLFHVTDKFKDVVEALEPNVHQFIPFELVGPRKKHVADLWFMFVCNRLDTVDRERTTLVLVDGKMWLPARDSPRDQWPSHVDSGTQSMLFFDLNRIGNHHLWFDKHIIQELPLVSENLANSLKDARVTGVAFAERRVAR
jgi:hypothetical protein